MIKFFRKIRYDLMSKNKTGKYFKYAIGEIILVVIGILIALQINNWNEGRKQRAEENVLLSQLKSDFTDNLNQLDQKINTRLSMLKSCGELFKLIDNPELALKDSIDLYIARAMPYASFDPIIHNFGSSGTLHLIKNNKLKQALTNWSADIQDVIEDEHAWKEYRHDHFIPFLVKHYQLRSVRNKAFKVNLLGSYSIERTDNNSSYTNYNIGSSKHNQDYVSLLKHPEFEDHLTRLYGINGWTNVQSNILRNRIVEIISLIDNELENK
ncbi:DUF6090 family protein [Ichthyenterobacterium sp. W332]|uniref:DUF6090 family protein n=1 Tax=Microcosmobacter mediterraneus TaxID=3075607 RepID=A0ABU2YJ57_9FLAO|nr:DUF6090 family protein [Ichthyenterobacterium sp. W332]MDT0557837.1 DUF6090 family protein [Ichthyenterobacterium sp. W332]